MVFALLILFTIAALGFIAWRSFDEMQDLTNVEPRSTAWNPVKNHKDLRTEAAEELYPAVDIGKEKIIPQIKATETKKNEKIAAPVSHAPSNRRTEAAEELHPVDILHKTIPKTEVPEINSHSHSITNQKHFEPARADASVASTVRTEQHAETPSMEADPKDRVIAIIPTLHSPVEQLQQNVQSVQQIKPEQPVPLNDWLQELALTESKLQTDLLKELESQLKTATSLVDRMNEQFLIAETLIGMEVQLCELQELTVSVNEKPLT